MGSFTRSSKRSRGRRQPYAWLGAGTLSLAVGAALAGASVGGAAVAAADTSVTTAADNQPWWLIGGSATPGQSNDNDNAAKPSAFESALATSGPFLGLFGDGTAAHPNAGLLTGNGFSFTAATCTGSTACKGGNGGLLIGNGGNGFNGGAGGNAGLFGPSGIAVAGRGGDASAACTGTACNGGTGGNALLFGAGGAGGNAAAGGTGGTGGRGGALFGIGGDGGNGGGLGGAGGVGGNGGFVYLARGAPASGLAPSWRRCAAISSVSHSATTGGQSGPAVWGGVGPASGGGVGGLPIRRREREPRSGTSGRARGRAAHPS